MKHNNVQLDSRSVQDLRGEIRRLAASYTPEWAFSDVNPDVGSVVGLIFANQMEENIRRMNLVMEKYHTEFVNMLNLSLRPAYPACGVVVMNLIEGSVSGVQVPAGTRLIGQDDGEDARQIFFETASDLYVTGAKLTDVFQASGSFGKLLPVRGGRPRQELPGTAAREERTAAEEEPLETERMPEIPLFDFNAQGVERWALVLTHDTLFRTRENIELRVAVRGPQGEDLSKQLADPLAFRWSYLENGAYVPFSRVEARDGAVSLWRTQAPAGTAENETAHECTEICVEALRPITENLTMQSLTISSSRDSVPPDTVYDGVSELEPASFLPFGETVSLFDECYLCADSVFSQRDASVEISFRLRTQEHLVTLSLAQEQEELRIIKRKPRTIQYQAARTSPQIVSLEYFNGAGWRRLACEEDWSSLFDGTHSGDFTIRFRCPADWRPLIVGGYEGRSLRLRVTRADDCYLQPCLHTMPRLENLKLSYSYADEWKQPQKVQRLCGTEVADLTRSLWAGEAFEGFCALPYGGNALYLGFDRPMDGAPVSLLFDVKENANFVDAPLRFEYSTKDGFEPLRVVDHTRNLSESGTVLFIPPVHFSRREIEGQKRWWIRLVDERGLFDNPDRYHPVIRRILPNAVEIRNRITMPEEVFYVTASVPNMEFSLSARNILSADVFVSEKSRLSVPAMRAMLEERPDDVRVEYDFLGEITEFYVRWTEVDNFDHSSPGDRHYMLDRMNNVLRFGDGVSVMIPPAQPGPAFTVQAVCCDGSAGNLPAGRVRQSFSQLLYVESLTNPLPVASGSDLESVESARERGANLICSKNRLVSELDFVREVKAFASSIRKVRCVVGRDFDGYPMPDAVSIAVMTKDYRENDHAFANLRDRLRAHLMQKSEATLQELLIGEPSYVEISVSVWAGTEDPDHAFELQEILRQQIKDYLDPFTGGSGRGWPIGVLPEEAQLSRMLHSVDCGLVVKRFCATARYTDRRGVHECSLSDMRPTPFMIGVSGTHTVSVRLK